MPASSAVSCSGRRRSSRSSIASSRSQQLGLDPHRVVLAGRHRDRPRHQAGQPGETHDRRSGIGARHAEDQPHVRHEPVAHPEHGGPSRPTLDVPVVVLGVDRGHVRDHRGNGIHRPAAAVPLSAVPSRYDLDRGALAELLAGEPRLPRRPGVGRAVPPARRTGRAHGAAQGAAGPARRRGPTGAHPGRRVHRRRRRHGEVAVRPGRRRPGRDRPDALPRPHHRLRVEPGRVRHGLRVLRHRPGRVPAPAHHRRDRRAGRAGGPPFPRRRSPPRQRRVHGHGRAARQPRQRVARGRAAARRRGAVGASPHDLDGRHGPRHPAPGRERPAGEPGRVAPRRQRRPPRRARPDQQALSAVGADRARAPTTCGPRAGACRSSGR